MNKEAQATTECFHIRQKCLKFPEGGEGGLPYKSDEQPVGKFKLNP